MYVHPNFKTKKAFKLAIQQNKFVTVFSPGPYPPERNGTESVEGPHFPKPHTWYARVRTEDGRVVKVLS